MPSFSFRKKKTNKGKGPEAIRRSPPPTFKPPVAATPPVSTLRSVKSQLDFLSPTRNSHRSPNIGLPVPDRLSAKKIDHHMMRSVLQQSIKQPGPWEDVMYDVPDHADLTVPDPQRPPPSHPPPSEPLYIKHRSTLLLYSQQDDGRRLELLASLPRNDQQVVQKLVMQVYDVMMKRGLELSDDASESDDDYPVYDYFSVVGQEPPKRWSLKLKERDSKKEKNRAVSTPALSLPAPFSQTHRRVTDPTILPRPTTPSVAGSYSGGNLQHFKKLVATPQRVFVTGEEVEEIMEAKDPEVIQKWAIESSFITISGKDDLDQELNSNTPTSVIPPVPCTVEGGHYMSRGGYHVNKTRKKSRIATSEANRNFRKIVDSFIAKEMGLMKYKGLLDVVLDNRRLGEDATLREYMSIVPESEVKELTENDPEFHDPSLGPDNTNYAQLALAASQEAGENAFSSRNGSAYSVNTSPDSGSLMSVSHKASSETIVYKPKALNTGNLPSTVVLTSKSSGTSQTMRDLPSSLDEEALPPVGEEDEEGDQDAPTPKGMGGSLEGMKRLPTMSDLHASELRDSFNETSSDVYSDADDITTPIPFSATIDAGDKARRRRRLEDADKEVEEVDEMNWNASVYTGFKKTQRRSVMGLGKSRVVSQRLEEESSKGVKLLAPGRVQAKKEFEVELKKKTEEALDVLSKSPALAQGQWDILKEMGAKVLSSPRDEDDVTEPMGKMGSQVFLYRKTLTTFSKGSEDSEALLAPAGLSSVSLPLTVGTTMAHLGARKPSLPHGSSPLANPPLTAYNDISSDGAVANGPAEGVFDEPSTNAQQIPHHPFRDPPPIPRLTSNAEGIIPSSPTNKFSGDVGRIRKWKESMKSRCDLSALDESAEETASNDVWADRLDRKPRPAPLYDGELPRLFGERTPFSMFSPGIQRCKLAQSYSNQRAVFSSGHGKGRKRSAGQERQLKKMYADQINEDGIYSTPDISKGGDAASPAPVSLRMNAFDPTRKLPKHAKSTVDLTQETAGGSSAAKSSRRALFGLPNFGNASSRGRIVSAPVQTSPKKIKRNHRLPSFMPSSRTIPKSMVPLTRIVVQDAPVSRSPERVPYEERESDTSGMTNSKTTFEFQRFAKKTLGYAERKRDSRLN